MHTQEMLATHPHMRGSADDALIRCIEECYDCAMTCTSCADACLGEDMVARLRQCIRLNLDCADICRATGALLTRRTGSNHQLVRRMLEACAEACDLCGRECATHASMHDHCRICADACHRCADACRSAMEPVH